MPPRGRISVCAAVTLVLVACDAALGIHDLPATGGPQDSGSEAGPRDATVGSTGDASSDTLAKDLVAPDLVAPEVDASSPDSTVAEAAPLDAPSPDAPSPDAPPPDATPDAGCPGVIAVVGGNSTSVYATNVLASGLQTTQAFASQPVAPLAVAASQRGFLAAFPGSSNAVYYTTYPAPLGDAGATDAAVGGGWASLQMAPVNAGSSMLTLLPSGDDVYVLYLDGVANEVAQYDPDLDAGSSWSVLAEPFQVGGGAPASAIFYQGQLLALFPSSTQYQGTVAEEVFANGAWTPIDQQFLPSTAGTTPAITTLDGAVSEAGVTFDALVVYADGGLNVMYTLVHNGMWTPPANVASGASANTAMTIVALSGGRALLVYLLSGAATSNAFWTVFDPSSTSWSTPQPLLPANAPPLSQAPSLAPGVCGDDAVAVIPPNGLGEAQLFHFRGGTWSASTLIAGSQDTTSAAVATHP